MEGWRRATARASEARTPRAAAGVCVAALAVALAGGPADGPTGASGADAVATEAEARAICGVTCHRYPPPDILPRAAWRSEIQLMARLRDERAPTYAETARSADSRANSSTGAVRPIGQDALRPAGGAVGAGADGTGPGRQPPLSAPLPADLRRVLAFYERHAPERLPAPEPWPQVDARFSTSTTTAAAAAPAAASAGARPATGDRPGLAFRRHLFAPEDDALATPAVSHVRFANLDRDARLELIGADMRYGLIFLLRPYAPADPMRVIAQSPAPAHITLADVDEDGGQDVLVADLGTFQPGDHRQGSAIWLRAVATMNFLPMRIGGLPRVADVEAADLDNDGRRDLIVSAFGWRRTGALSWWRASAKAARFEAAEMTTIDPRTGAIHALPVDLDRDADIDIVALFAQEHEEVAAFVNDGHGRFASRVIYTAPHPNWGSSGIELVDLDRDGDLDVLLAHGDMFDDFVIKPYHGVQWLENRGDYPFTAHTLATLPGVHRATAADLDGDGDLDIVAAAMIPEQATGSREAPSVVWLEQVAPGTFRRHTLERGAPRHATLDAADFDRDGDIDLAIGVMTGSARSAAWVEIWENLASSPSTSAPAARGERDRRQQR